MKNVYVSYISSAEYIFHGYLLMRRGDHKSRAAALRLFVLPLLTLDGAATERHPSGAAGMGI